MVSGKQSGELCIGRSRTLCTRANEHADDDDDDDAEIMYLFHLITMSDRRNYTLAYARFRSSYLLTRASGII